MTTKIEWVKNADGTRGETWNPLVGCTKVSKGCAHCFAERMAVRQIGMGNKNYAGTIKDGHWSGKVNLIPDALEKPLHWRKPRTVFVNSMSDLFHESVPFEFIDKVFAIMALAKWHTFQVLTKRPERMREYMKALTFERMRVHMNANSPGSWFTIAWRNRPEELKWNRIPTCQPPPNIHLYVSIEDQATADERIPWLLKTPAAVRGVSLEPMLGPVDLRPYLRGEGCTTGGVTTWLKTGPVLDHVIVGGETGPGAGPMHPDWVRSVRDQCAEAGVSLFFKGWGDWCGGMQNSSRDPYATLENGQMFCKGASNHKYWGDGYMSARVGKRAAGRELDGRTWDEMPGQAKEE